MPAPRLNTIEKDVEQFAAERAQQLMETQKFKIGQPENGLVAVNRLEAMYQVLLSSFHQVQNPIEAAAFIKQMSEVRKGITKYLKLNPGQSVNENIQNDKFMKLVNDFDDAVYRFYEIKAELKSSG